MKINQRANETLELISIYLNQNKLSEFFIRFLNCLIINSKCTRDFADKHYRVRDWTKKGHQ